MTDLPRKILIVEDETITAQHLRRSLTRLGYEVVGVARTGAAAIRQAGESRPDLVLADIGLPGDTDGIQVAAQVRQLWNVPTVFLTAYTDEGTMTRARAVEPYGYLVKPFAEQELHATVEVALKQHSIAEHRKQQTETTARILQNTREELYALAARLVSAAEEERQRIARDLHDDVVQRLALLQIDIEQLQQRVGGSEVTQFHAITERLGEITGALRNLSHQLHPSSLDDLGLAAALRQLAREFQLKHAIPIQVSIRTPSKAIPKATAISLYRIAQEALGNIARHAGPASVQISLVGRRQTLELSIQDTGRGFDADAARKRGGLGLISMAQRAELSGGTFALESQPGAGTQVRVSVPVLATAEQEV